MGLLAHLQQPLQHGYTVDAHRSIRRTEGPARARAATELEKVATGRSTSGRHKTGTKRSFVAIAHFLAEGSRCRSTCRQLSCPAQPEHAHHPCACSHSDGAALPHCLRAWRVPSGDGTPSIRRRRWSLSKRGTN